MARADAAGRAMLTRRHAPAVLAAAAARPGATPKLPARTGREAAPGETEPAGVLRSPSACWADRPASSCASRRKRAARMAGADMVQGVAPRRRWRGHSSGRRQPGREPVLALGARWGGARGWDILGRSCCVRCCRCHRPWCAPPRRVTQASAGAVGREDDRARGGGDGVGIGRRFGVPTRERRLLVACGSAADRDAYNTPLRASLFAMEILLGGPSLEAFAPLAISSATATYRAGGFAHPSSTCQRRRCRRPSSSAMRRARRARVVGALFLFAPREGHALRTQGCPGPRDSHRRSCARS